MDQLLLSLLHLRHQFEKLGAVGTDEHVQHAAILGDMGGTAHLHREATAAASVQVGLELGELTPGKGFANRVGSVRGNEIIKGQLPVGFRVQTGALEKFAVGLNNPEFLGYLYAQAQTANRKGANREHYP